MVLKLIGCAAAFALAGGFAAGSPALAQAPATAPAAPPPANEQSFHALIAAGFKVAATTFIPGEIQSDKHPVVLVTLQKDTAVAVCTFGFGSWETMGSSTSMDDDKACDFRQY